MVKLCPAAVDTIDLSIYKEKVSLSPIARTTVPLDCWSEVLFSAFIEDISTGKSEKSSNKNDDNKELDPPSIYLPLYLTLFFIKSDRDGSVYFVKGFP